MILNVSSPFVTGPGGGTGLRGSDPIWHYSMVPTAGTQSNAVTPPHSATLVTTSFLEPCYLKVSITIRFPKRLGTHSFKKYNGSPGCSYILLLTLGKYRSLECRVYAPESGVQTICFTPSQAGIEHTKPMPRVCGNRGIFLLVPQSHIYVHMSWHRSSLNFGGPCSCV